MGDKVNNNMASTTKCGLMSLNCNKAGMVGLDKEKINQVIEAASKGSKFFAKKQEDQARIDNQVADMKLALSGLSNSQLERARKETDKVVERLRIDRDLSRTIVHVDMDMFYAAVEMKDNPRLSNVPMAVGGMGMLSTSNYLARKFGVRAAMPGFIAKKLCPKLVIVPSNMEKYAQVAEVVRGVFKEYDQNFAPMSLDEAYLDITHLLADQDSQVTAWSIVQEMRGKICDRTGLTASAGIAPNCLLAKVCSDLNKPNGQHQLEHNSQDILHFVSSLSIRKVGGIGNVSEQLLKAVGVQTCEDLYIKRAEIRLLFSENGSDFYLAVSQGIGSTRIEPPEERERKSISTETTFRETSDRGQLMETLAELCKDLANDCNEKSITGQAVTVKIKSHDFKLKTKVSQMCQFTNSEELIHATAKKILTNLLDSSDEQPLSLRLMGVRLTEFRDKNDPSSKQRQGNILAFVRGDGSSTQAGTSKTGTIKYQCPMCDHEVNSLKHLNDHIDNCISSTPPSKITKTFETTKVKKVTRKSEATSDEDMFDVSEPIEDLNPNNELLEAEKEKFTKVSAKLVSGSFFHQKILECLSPEKLVKKPSKITKTFETTKVKEVSRKSEPTSDEDMFDDSECIEDLNPNNESLEVEKEKLTKVSAKLVSGSFFKQKIRECLSPEKLVAPSTILIRPSSPLQDSHFTCPVCFSSDNFQTDEDLSRHVEDCLSKQEIANILHADQSENMQQAQHGAAHNLNKRKSVEVLVKADKRSKNSSNLRIDSYFKPT